MKHKFWSICNSDREIISKSKDSLFVFDTKKEALKRIKWFNFHKWVRGVLKEEVYLARCEIVWKKVKE